MKFTEKPKSLPWLARKAGVSDHLAETLWNKALALASAGNAHGAESRRMAAAMQHLLAMLDGAGREQHGVNGSSAATGFLASLNTRMAPPKCVPVPH